MWPAFSPAWRSYAFVIAAAATPAVVFFLLFGHVHLTNADEGFLWYGVRRVLAGEIPLRDFESYDPGRYYWAAAWAAVLGSGPIVLRLATAAFGAIGVGFGLLALRRATTQPAILMTMGALLTAHMLQWWKNYDFAMSLLAVWSLTCLLERPTTRRYFVAGLVVGLAAFIGRNHGFYSGVATLMAVATLVLVNKPGGLLKSVSILGAGVVVGYAPMLLLLLFAPGFVEGFMEFTERVLVHGANLPRPWPWPWSVGAGDLEGLAAASKFAFGIAFQLPLLVLPIGWVIVARTRGANLQATAPVIAATLVATVYLHHQTSRPDPSHYGQAIGPAMLLTACLVLRLGNWQRWVVGCAVTVLLTLCVLDANPPLRAVVRSSKLVPYVAAGDTLLIPRHARQKLRLLDAMLSRRMAPGDRIYIGPGQPGYYVLFDKVSPVWGIYLTWPRTQERQRKMILDLEPVRFALLVDVPPDQEGRSLQATHPLVWDYLHTEFEEIENRRLPADHRLLVRR